MEYQIFKKRGTNSLKMISNNSIKKILKKAGALRIGDEAIKKLKILTEDYALVIARKF